MQLGPCRCNSTEPSEIRRDEYLLEQAVTAYIGAMPFVWLEIDDPCGPASDLGVVEAGAIALLSNFDRPPVDASSDRWLGLQAERERVRASGMWNVNHVQNAPSDGFLVVLEKYLR